MELDYGYTCGTIDTAKDDFEEQLDRMADQILDDASPLFGGADRRDYVKEVVSDYLSELDHIFEDVRKCNQDMRDAANDQIETLVQEKEELENEISDKEDHIRELENEIIQLKLHEN